MWLYRRGMRAIFLFFIVLSVWSGAALAATTIPLTVTMSETVVVTGTPRLAVDVGGTTRYATFSGGSGSATLSFTLTPEVGDVDLDGITLISPLELNGGTIKDAMGQDAVLSFTLPNTSGVKVSYPSLGMDFTSDADGRYSLNGTVYNDLGSLLTAAGGSFGRTGSGSYYDSAGVLQTAATNVPRFDHDPVTHARKGLLLEGARTNQLLYSEELENAVYTLTWATVTSNLTTAPNGQLTADKLIESVNTTPHLIMQNSAVTNTTSYSFSIYAKAAGRSIIQIAASTAFDLTNTWANYDLSAGSVGYTGGLGTASIENVGNGWYRCIFTATSNSSNAAGRFVIAVLDSNKNSRLPSHLGDGTSDVYLWGMQFESSQVATSYISTTSAAATRGADVLVIPTGSWYNQAAGTMASEIAWASSAGTFYPMLWRFDDTTNNNRWNFHYDQNVNQLGISGYNAGVMQGGFSLASAGTSGTAKVAAAQGLNSANAAYNGVLKTLDTTWQIGPVTQYAPALGSGRAWHAKVRYYPVRVPDAQLVLLSQ